MIAVGLPFSCLRYSPKNGDLPVFYQHCLALPGHADALSDR